MLRKIRVTVDDMDEEFAAIQGEVDKSDDIVLSSDKELSGGNVKIFQGE